MYNLKVVYKHTITILYVDMKQKLKKWQNNKMIKSLSKIQVKTKYKNTI